MLSLYFLHLLLIMKCEMEMSPDDGRARVGVGRSVLKNHLLKPGGRLLITDKRISQAVCLTRDAIESVKPSQKVALYETDYISAFDLMSIDWILKVLLKKGCSKTFVQVLRNIFQEEDTFVSCVINNEVQPRILNRRKNIKLAAEAVPRCTIMPPTLSSSSSTRFSKA